MSDGRRAEIVAAARELLEQEGEAALSMRRLADRLGMRAPSLYKHVADKAELEIALLTQGLEEFGAAMRAAGPGFAELAAAYRAWALAHPHLYRLMTDRPLPRDRLPAGVEQRAAEPVLAALGDPDRARAAWAAAHGLASLELAGRFPPDADLDAAWAVMGRAFERPG